MKGAVRNGNTMQEGEISKYLQGNNQLAATDVQVH